VPRGIDELTPRGRQEPGVGVVRNAGTRPGFQRRQERVAERVLGRRYVPPRRREVCDEPAVGRSGRQLRGAMRVDVVLGPSSWAG